MPDLDPILDTEKPSSAQDSRFVQIFLARRQQLEAIVRRKVGCTATAADLVQDLFLRFWKKRPTSVESLDQYLLRSAHNLAIDHLRTENSRQRVFSSQEYSQSTPAEAGPNLEDLLQATDALQLVEQALAALPERTRHIFLLNRVHGCTYADIAKSMDLSQSSVEKHMMRALDACKVALKQQYPDFSHASRNDPL